MIIKFNLFESTFITKNGSVYYLNGDKTERDKKTTTGRIEKWSEVDKTLYMTKQEIDKLADLLPPFIDISWSDDSATFTNEFGRTITLYGDSKPKIGLIPMELTKGIDNEPYKKDKRINIKTQSLSPYGVNFHTGHEIIEINENYNPTVYDMMKNPKTTELLDETGFKESFIKRFISNPQNYEENVYYHVNCETGESGVGRGLYLGKDKKALRNFYDIEGYGYKIDKYIGNPKWLNLMDYDDYKKFENNSIKKYGKLPFNEHLKEYCLELGFDGIIYFDPQATGEEYVLYNTKMIDKK